SRHDANLRFRHRHVQPGKILHVGSPLPMTKPILSASAEEPRPLPDVEEVCFEVLRRRGSAVATMFVSGVSPQVAEVGVGIGISMASLRRFWAVAARWNSSRAPFGPRNRRRSSFKMRLRWANSISTFLR